VKDDLKTIAAGGQPEWSGTYQHPQHGELVFRAKLPRARDLMRHTVEMDNQTEALDGISSNGTAVFAASIAGLKTLIRLPVLREDRGGRGRPEPRQDHEGLLRPRGRVRRSVPRAGVAGLLALAQGTAGRSQRAGEILRGDEWERLKRVVQRRYGLPFNDPRLEQWTEADYLREFAFLMLEEEDPVDPDRQLVSDEEFDEEIAAASRGEWEALGLDGPGFTPVSVEEFMRDE
jgi:hypothetical protein